ncbi:hypothetical protein C8R47DRAFT_1222266 [Mycena vitilis]|nr:hypothetical protein C8R47DRAFT_1222266 [Mycena vitilis]
MESERFDWKANVNKYSDLLNFVREQGSRSLAGAVYGSDFIPPVDCPGATEFTDENQTGMYDFMVFGRVRSNPDPTDRSNSYFIEGPGRQYGALQALFDRQLETLSTVIIGEDELNDPHRLEPCKPCTDSDRVTGKGGSYIEFSVGKTLLHGTDHNILVMDRVAAKQALHPGDWILMAATLHCAKDPDGDCVTSYFLIAEHIRVLVLAPGEGADDTELDEENEKPRCAVEDADAAEEHPPVVATPKRKKRSRVEAAVALDTSPMTRGKRRRLEEESPGRIGEGGVAFANPRNKQNMAAVDGIFSHPDCDAFFMYGNKTQDYNGYSIRFVLICTSAALEKGKKSVVHEVQYWCLF